MSELPATKPVFLEGKASESAMGAAALWPEQAPVLITGIAGRLGRRLARRLHRVGQVVGIDRRPFDDRAKDIEHHQIDLRRKKMRELFRNSSAAAVVHLGVRHDPRAGSAEQHIYNVGGFQKILEYVSQYDIPKLIVLSSASVYGPRADNPQFLAEEAPLLGGATVSELRDLVEVDMLAQSFFWKRPATETVILRPVHILGTVRNAASNYLRLPVIPTLMGFDPMMQVIHEEDVVRAIELALVPGVRGIFNLAGPSPVPLSRIIRILGRPSIPIPHAIAASVVRRLWSMHIRFPAPDLDHFRYVCMVDDGRAQRVLGYRPKKALETTVHGVDEGRWV